MLDIFQNFRHVNMSNLFLEEHLLIAVHVWFGFYCQCVIFLCTHRGFFVN